ncbi:MAG: hypothetical protein Q4E05_00040 [Pseudoclavibacter sp.]|nr:hypothetical protein [Pseudoclavibacter sp.]
MTGPYLEIIEGELLALSGKIDESASGLESQRGFQAAAAAVPSSIPGASSSAVLQRSGEALDREIDQIVRLLRGASQDIADLDGEFTALDEQCARGFASVSTASGW